MDKQTVISKETLIPVGVAAVISVALLSAGWTAASSFADLRQAVEKNNAEIRMNRATLQRLDTSHWQRAHMKAWADLLQARNPDLSVPEIR